jgi:hypothetical protein
MGLRQGRNQHDVPWRSSAQTAGQGLLNHHLQGNSIMATSKRQTTAADSTAPAATATNAVAASSFCGPIDDDFRFVLDELLAAYRPVLEADLARANQADALIKEGLEFAPSCEDEFKQASALFERFGNEAVAQRLLPAALREQLGPVERWRWCLTHLRCCIVFGCLMCRGNGGFSRSSYYLYRYWRCVRELLGAPVANPPTAAEHADFATLVKAMAQAYKPYLDDELASVEFPQALPDQILAGTVDCETDTDASAQILERLLTTDTATALMGRELIAKYRHEPLFWFCRCWCLCAIRFGCCLARARNLRDVLRCLCSYRDCLKHCLRPLHCAIHSPTGCVRGFTDILPGRILEPVKGDAEGLNFGHYVIEVRDSAAVLMTGVVIYPNALSLPDPGAAHGNFVVSGGTLGWIDLRQCVIEAGIDLYTSTSFSVTLRLFAADGSEVKPPCTTSFSLSANEVFIKRISTPWSHDFMDPDSPLRAADDAVSALSTEGGAMHVRGSANVFGCLHEKISEYTIWAISDSGFAIAQPAPFTAIVPGAGWTLVTHIQYSPQTIPQPSPNPPINYTADQVREFNVLDGDPVPDVLTNVWGSRSECICVHIDSINLCICWNVPALIPNAFLSTTLPAQDALHHEGATGKFTFLLQVVDTNGNTYYDIQRAWIDNEPVHGTIVNIGNQPPCSDLYTQTTEGVFKTVAVRGYAWDQLIALADLTKPTSDNFARYLLQFQKQSAAGWATLADSPDPVPARPAALAVGDLALWDLRSLDAGLNPMGLPADQLLAPGQACTYTVTLQVWDSTVVNEGDVHHLPFPVTFPIKIINGPEPV